MIFRLAEWLPEQRFRVVADGAYASLLRYDLPRTVVITRLRPTPPSTISPRPTWSSSTAYGELEFDVPVATDGDALARFRILESEIRQSLRIADQLVGAWRDGDHLAKCCCAVTVPIYEGWGVGTSEGARNRVATSSTNRRTVWVADHTRSAYDQRR